MRKKTQNFIIPLVIYPFDVMISIEETDEMLSKKLQRYVIDPEGMEAIMNLPKTCQGRCVMLDSNQTVIRLKRQFNKHSEAAVIAHEIFHAATFILNRVGMKLELHTSCEAYAYLIGYLTKEIYKKI